MPDKPDKPHRLRVQVIDNKPREYNKIKGQLVPHVDVHNAKDNLEFVICATKEAHLEQVRQKLAAAGLSEIQNGNTTVNISSSSQSKIKGYPGMSHHTSNPKNTHKQNSGPNQADTKTTDLNKKPYGFVALPEKLTIQKPIWHDGTCSENRLTGEIRFDILTLTPLLVGWERRIVGEDHNEPWPVPGSMNNVGTLKQKKPVLCPLRAPWGQRPVVIPGDSIKGLLRHELGVLLSAPMERVAERTYSYRPNMTFPKDPNPRLIARLARIPQDGVEMKELDQKHQVRVPVRLELLPTNLAYDRNRNKSCNYYRFDDGNGSTYRGGQGAGEKLNSKRPLHFRLTVNPTSPTESVKVTEKVQEGYLSTLRHMTNLTSGHFSERHPDVPKTVKGEETRNRILHAAANDVFKPKDLIWVEWDTENKAIVSFGWHYYYRWAYIDSVRRKGTYKRDVLFPLKEELDCDTDGAPVGLSSVRRLFGYTAGDDNEGSAGIGQKDYTQLMGRVSVNAAVEVVGENETDNERFLLPTFLKELGLPRPSAVEFYLRQPDFPNPEQRPDRARFLTYGDAAGYDKPGDLAGRKFYLDRKDAYTSKPWEDKSPTNRESDRSTLAIDASMPERKFRFTIRFRDLDEFELASILVALCPHQFRDILEGKHESGYCSKLGYARPLGWGTVRIEVKALLLLTAFNNDPELKRQSDIFGFVKKSFKPTSTNSNWLAVHRHKHPDAEDYPREADRSGKSNIFTFHTNLRTEHIKLRRYKRDCK